MRKEHARRPAAGYPSTVCSIPGDAIEEIVAAIDQLANDARVKTEPDLTARVAEIWSMVTALDPELARRQRGYAAPADGAPPL